MSGAILQNEVDLALLKILDVLCHAGKLQPQPGKDVAQLRIVMFSIVRARGMSMDNPTQARGTAHDFLHTAGARRNATVPAGARRAGSSTAPLIEKKRVSIVMETSDF